MAGLRVLNDSGWVQINSEQRNLALLGKGMGVTNQPLAINFPLPTVAYTGLVEVSGAVMVAFRSSVPMAVQSTNASPAGGSSRGFIFFSNTNGAAFDWWAFGPSTNAVFNSGIRIWNAASEQVYDGADPLPKMHGITGRVDANSAGSIGSSAPLLALAPLLTYTGTQPPGYYMIAAAKLTGASTADYSSIPILVSNSSLGTTPCYGQWLLLDVAGL